MEANRGSGVNPPDYQHVTPEDAGFCLSKVHPQETNAGSDRGLFDQQIKIRARAKRLVRVPRGVSAARQERQRKSDVAQKMRDLEFPTITTTELVYRHGGWESKRARVINAFIANNVTGLRRQHFENCGSSCRVLRKQGTDDLRLVGFFCHDRMCDPCKKQRARLLAANITAQIDNDKFNRMITLTLLHVEKPLKERLDHLYKSFRLMRLMPAWRDTQKGGVTNLEVKLGRDGLWHPHLHLIAQGTYIAGKQLSNCWLSATKDSWRVDVGIVRDRIGAASYVANYTTKTLDAEVYEHPDKLAEAMTALKGVRITNSFGCWRRYQLLAKPPLDGVWEPVCSLQDLLNGVCRKEPWAIAVMTNCQKHRLGEWTDDGEPPPF